MKMNTSEKRKAQQSRTEIPSKIPHQNHQQQEQKGEEEIGNDHNKPISSVPYLSTLIIFEILSRVGIKTLFNCRLVCKSWADLTSTPEFAQLHLSNSPTSCLLKPLNKEERQFSGLHLVDLECPLSLCNKLVFIPKINLPNVPLVLINSCNGLVCLLCPLFYTDCNIYVCNPVLGEYISLPKPSHVKEIHSYCCAFGFSHKTNQYKVLLTSYTKPSDDDDSQTEIYTLGERSWRSIENPPYPIRNVYPFNAFLNGALHWIPFEFRTRCRFICCFDFESEQFRGVPQPSEFGQLKIEWPRLHAMQIGVINGNLSICDFDYAFGYIIVVIWVMNDYGVKESWSKDFVITPTIHKLVHGRYEPIMITSNGEILMIVRNEYIMLYDPKSKTFKSQMQIFGGNSEFHAIAHVPCLISLKDVAKGENLKVLG